MPDMFDRQVRIPGWNQQAIEAQRVGIIGVGGNGAPLLQTLLSIGVGRQGFIAYADHDSVEKSNLPRLPYACDDQVGTPKVVAATQYASRKSPSTRLYPFQSRFNDPAVLERFKMATVLFFCGDSDGGRKEVNEFSVRYGIPLIDLGCDIQVQESQVIAGGQVRLVLPGENACLVCCGGYDAGQAALDQMGDEARAERAAQGYVRGADAEATPSVANLNGLTAQHAVSQFLALVHGEQFAQWDYLHFDQFTGRTICAQTHRLPQCPLCGDNQQFLSGDATNTGTTPRTVPAKFKQDPSKKLDGDLSHGEEAREMGTLLATASTVERTNSDERDAGVCDLLSRPSCSAAHQGCRAFLLTNRRTTMATKKQTTAKQTLVHTIRVGEIVADIHRRQSNAGFSYYDYTLSRQFAMATGRQATGTSFFDRSEHDILEAVRAASAWIRERVQSDIVNQSSNTARRGCRVGVPSTRSADPLMPNAFPRGPHDSKDVDHATVPKRPASRRPANTPPPSNRADTVLICSEDTAILCHR